MATLPRKDELSDMAVRARYRAKAMAGLCGMSSRHFRRLFRLRLRVSPREFLERLRLARARRLVLAGLGGKRLAEQLGFSSKNHFSRFFKARNGLTARQYVARNRASARQQI
jgi:AraC-like DNA-binding protein